MIIDNNKLPKHIAIIPDGNRRWAEKHKLDAWLGHKKGAEYIDKLVDVIIEMKIPYLSFWGSSKDNLQKRPEKEVEFLLKLFKQKFLTLSTSEKVIKNEVKINIIGDWRNQFPEDVKDAMNQAIENTKNYKKHFMNFFIAYSGTEEMMDVARCIAEKARKNLSLEINKDLIKSCLLTFDLPSVDLVVRTGGESHLSDGFMMWETANSQLYFSDKLYPDFNKNDFREAIEDYSKRERRFGK
ncbi:MAG: di-trans,poly-cis-decaprenylcistransferase [Candidatus Pacebacteria bacterium]|nr:di-trans,poly-cis-decaprenylcistransferase [Candidatus Paceibacterota bacterium]